MTAVSQPVRPLTGDGLAATDLLAGAQTLTVRLAGALRGEQWLDAYLLAAGLSQLAADRLHDDPFMLNRAASYLRGRPSRPARLAGALSGAAGTVLRARTSQPRSRLRHGSAALAELTLQLAGQVVAPGQPRPAAARLAGLLAAVQPALPMLAGDVLRLPTCFHSFDQHPDDVRWLAAAFARRYDAAGTALAVVGVRTSGSYLAPLLAAALAAAGHPAASVLTYRPGRPFLRPERAALRAVASAGGLVLITDDPPASGTSLAAAARAVAAAGVPGGRIVLLLSLVGTASELPAALRRWPAVVQPWGEWSVHRRLAPAAVRAALASLAGPGTGIGEVQPLGPPGPAGDRGHVRARYRVTFADRRTGARASRQVVAEGAGLGYLGRQSEVVARALPGQLPQVYGFADGLLYRDWLPAGPPPAPGPALAATIAGYVTARRDALPAPAASVAGLGGRDPVWEVAARLLSAQYGPLSVPARPLLLDPLARRLLRPAHPTVIDGKTDRRHWLADPADGAGGLRKADYYQRTFGHLDLACYDPVCDLAGAAADPPAPGFERQLREAYQRLGGEQVDAEQWLLYRLAQLWRLGRAGDIPPPQVRRQSAAAVHDYLAYWYLPGDRGNSSAGPVCAIDLDGVLECDRLGYPATSPAGALALRALIAHGYRPVLVTGRSLPDVQDRCAAFGLAGGVAEYGAVLWAQGEAADLRPPPARSLLGRVRAELAACPGVQLDPRYRYGIRARWHGGPLPPELLARVPSLAGPGAQVIHGQGQTDIIAAGTGKGDGLRALAARLGDPGCALAVGDSAPDLPMLAQAELARAPRNARLPAGSGVSRTRHAYQAGLADACAALLGHRPGRCPACRMPALAPRTRAVLAVLDLHSGGPASIPGRTAAVCAQLLRGGIR